MAVDYKQLGIRISYFRNKHGLSQEELGERIHVTNTHISRIENNKNKPSIDTLVDIANALGVSLDDLLVDSLEHSVSTADSEIHLLLLDCNDTEQKVLIRMVRELKAILYGLGI